MNITLRPVPQSDKAILNNLLEKYNYEFSQYDKIPFGRDGLFNYWPLDLYWTDERRAAYFIMADDNLAGFALINDHPECEKPLDWAVAEFFVAYPYRRMGVGSRVMEEIFRRHKGVWHIKYHTANKASVAFWNGVAQRHAAGQVEKLRGTEDYYDGTPSEVLVFETK
jgi:predicted acetyltransferase